jgi:hypothetical protein
MRELGLEPTLDGRETITPTRVEELEVVALHGEP